MAAAAVFLAGAFLFSALLAWIAIPRHLGESHPLANVKVRKVAGPAGASTMRRSRSSVRG